MPPSTLSQIFPSPPFTLLRPRSTIRTIKDVIKVLKSQTSLAGLLWLLGALLAGIAAFFATRLALRASKGI